MMRTFVVVLLLLLSLYTVREEVIRGNGSFHALLSAKATVIGRRVLLLASAKSPTLEKQGSPVGERKRYTCKRWWLQRYKARPTGRAPCA